MMDKRSLLHVSMALLTLIVLAVHTAVALEDTCAEEITYEMRYKKLLDSVKEVKALFPKCRDSDEVEGECGKRDRAIGHLNLITDTLKGFKESGGGDRECPKCPDPKIIGNGDGPVDCSEILQLGNKKSGIYKIYPKSRVNGTLEISVYCDMDTDGGGWTVIQRRAAYSEQTDFHRNWEDYKKGFGNLSREFWLGNENIHTLTNQGVYSLRVDLRNSAGVYRYSQHNSFWIGDEWSNYVLHVHNFTGNVSNDLQANDNLMFSTKDRQNDGHAANDQCAIVCHGAWWYPTYRCGLVNLNAMYLPHIASYASNWWYYFTDIYGVAFSEMKIRHRYPNPKEKDVLRP